MAWHTTTAVVFPPKDDRGDSPKRKQTHSASLGRWYTKASDAYACGMLMIMPRCAQQLGRLYELNFYMMNGSSKTSYE